MSARGANAPEKHTFQDVQAYFSGIFYAPNSKVEFIRGRLNGICKFLCFVSDTLKLTSTYANYAYSMTRAATNPFGGTAELPTEPPALQRTFRPYLLNEVQYGFF